jgi:hypothetical protein
MNNHIKLMILSVFSLGVMACQGPGQSQYSTASKNISQNSSDPRSKFCFAPNDEYTRAYMIGKRSIASCNPAAIVRQLVPDGWVDIWEFKNDREIQRTQVFYPDKFFPWGSQKNPYVWIAPYQRNGNVFVENVQGCKQVNEIVRETETSITIMTTSASGNCQKVVLDNIKKFSKTPTTYLKIKY